MANDVKEILGTPITFLSTGGSYAFTPTSLAQNTGRVSAQGDLGTAPRARFYEWRAKSKSAGTVVVGDALVDIYLSTSDGTYQDGTPGTTDAALSNIEKARNMQYVGSLIIEATATGAVNSMGIVELPNRYVSVVFVNRLSTAVALSSTASDHGFQLTPILDEIQ